MPAEFDRCVRALMKDPDFKPKDEEQTKKDAAYAVCTAQYKERHGKNPTAASYYDNRDLMGLNSILYNTESLLTNLYPLTDSYEDEAVKDLVSNMIKTVQKWVKDAATLRSRLYPTGTSAAIKAELDALSSEDPALKFVVLWLEKDEELWKT